MFYLCVASVHGIVSLSEQIVRSLVHQRLSANWPARDSSERPSAPLRDHPPGWFRTPLGELLPKGELLRKGHCATDLASRYDLTGE
jgi:hypothetical protein